MTPKRPPGRTLDLDELEDVAGGEFKGLYGQVGVGATLGPFSANAGFGVSPGVLGHGALYDTTSYGVGRPGLGVNVGGTVGAVFGHEGASFDDIVMGGNQTVNFLVGRVSWNDNGMYVGVGPTGLGYSRGGTTRADAEGEHAPLDPGDGRDHSNDAAPELTDWSSAFGDHELSAAHDGDSAHTEGNEHSELARDAGIDDIGAHVDAPADASEHANDTYETNPTATAAAPEPETATDYASDVGSDVSSETGSEFGSDFGSESYDSDASAE